MNIAQKIARLFTLGLQETLTVSQWRDLLARNTAETDATICHSHDFCDANVPMAMAFAVVLGREVDLRIPEDVRIWNETWAIAKASWGNSPARTNYKCPKLRALSLHIETLTKEQLRNFAWNVCISVYGDKDEEGIDFYNPDRLWEAGAIESVAFDIEDIGLAPSEF